MIFYRVAVSIVILCHKNMPANLPYADTYINMCRNDSCEVDTKFVNWINNVERYVHSKLNMYLGDLADECYMVSFEEKVTWKEMAKTVVNNSIEIFL